MLMRRFLLLAYIIVVLLLAFLPPMRLPQQAVAVSGFIKVYHVVAFVPLTILMWLTFSQNQSVRPAFVNSALTAFLFGVIIESAQAFIPYRTGRWQDLVSNALGIAIGLFYIGAAVRRKQR